ncbi:hypothetical protein ACGIF2_06950 [Cellulomonas sp. P22]
MGEVAVPMRLHSSDGLGADLRLEVGLVPYPEVRVSGVRTGGLPDFDHYSEPLGIVMVHAPDASLAEQLFSRADVLVRGIALLVAAVALLPVLRSIAAGSPFRPGHGRRVQVVAVCVVAGAYVGPLLPWRASTSVLERLPDPYGMTANPPHHVEALVIAALVVLVGAVVRAGTPVPPPTTSSSAVRNPDIHPPGAGRVTS